MVKYSTPISLGGNGYGVILRPTKPGQTEEVEVRFSD
jgi:hypothetical protein